ncbi:POK19 protein, partial [Corythaixoides concolor]|nr:POK19 protein [Corythaixoides concolor]
QGRETACIRIPLTQEQLEWYLANSVMLQNTFLGFTGQVSIHYPSHKMLSALQDLPLQFRPWCCPMPVEGITVFTDGSGKTGKAAIVWKDDSGWNEEVQIVKGSPQIVELSAVVAVFKKWEAPFNLITDSQYICGVVQCIEYAWLKEVSNEQLFFLFKALLWEVNHRINDFNIMHIHSHTNLPDFIAEGNARADTLTLPVWSSPVPDRVQQAMTSCAFYHQSVTALRCQFHLSWSEA